MSPAMIELRAGEDIIQARLRARDMARTVGLGVMDQTRFATAVSELGRNAVRYAVGGECQLQDLSDGRQWRVQARVHDLGPGIADVARAMQDGYSTGGSLGAGLPGTRRLVDHFEITSSPAGTCVTIEIIRLKRT
jgi:serine/threonine-protein kinase RsbT